MNIERTGINAKWHLAMFLAIASMGGYAAGLASYFLVIANIWLAAAFLVA